MINYALNYPDKLYIPLIEHVQLMTISLVLSIIFATVLIIVMSYFEKISSILISIFSLIYSIPSLALFVLLIPLTGLGEISAIIVLVLYNQYLLLKNIVGGINDIDSAIIESAIGIGMNKFQLLFIIKIPLAKRAIFNGVRLSVVSTIGIGTIAAFINAGGLGSILNDGLRTINTVKILWGSILSSGLAVSMNAILNRIAMRL